MSLSKRSTERAAVSFKDDPGRTKQQFKKECDINQILAKFQKTGALEHVREHGGAYGDFTGLDFQTAQNIVAQGNTLFEELPSSLRKKFGTPQGFLDFVQNPDNADALEKYGLALKDGVAVARAAKPTENQSTPVKKADSSEEKADAKDELIKPAEPKKADVPAK